MAHFFFFSGFSPVTLQDETLQLSVTDSHLDADQRMWPVSLTRTGPKKKEFGQFATIKNVRLSLNNKISKQVFVLNAVGSFLSSKFTFFHQFCTMSFNQLVFRQFLVVYEVHTGVQ